jgi:hypothetical protein
LGSICDYSGVSDNRTKRLGLAIICVALFMFGACSLTRTSTTPAVVLAIPGNQDLANLKNEWTDPSSGKKIHVDITFSAILPSPNDSDKYFKSGAVPFHITALMMEIREVKGEKVERKLTGDKAQVLVYNHDGKPVVNEIVPMIALCPT